MSEIYTGRQYTRKENERGKYHFKAGKMLLKQISAALVCTLIAWGMSVIPAVRLNEYAIALGKAIRYETDTEMFVELYEDIKNIFAGEKEEVIPENTDSVITEH